MKSQALTQGCGCGEIASSLLGLSSFVSVGEQQGSNECVVMLTERQVLRTGSATHRSNIVTLEPGVLPGHSRGVLEAALESSPALEYGGDSTYNPAAAWSIRRQHLTPQMLEVGEGHIASRRC